MKRYAPPVQWSPEFDQAAKHEGWSVFQCDDGYLRIQRLDSPSDVDESLPHEPMFASDQAAIRHVQSGTMPHHNAALMLHEFKLWDA